jgi:hypothetical protein
MSAYFSVLGAVLLFTFGVVSVPILWRSITEHRNGLHPKGEHGAFGEWFGLLMMGWLVVTMCLMGFLGFLQHYFSDPQVVIRFGCWYTLGFLTQIFRYKGRIKRLGTINLNTLGQLMFGALFGPWATYQLSRTLLRRKRMSHQ